MDQQAVPGDEMMEAVDRATTNMGDLKDQLKHVSSPLLQTQLMAEYGAVHAVKRYSSFTPTYTESMALCVAGQSGMPSRLLGATDYCRRLE